VRIDEARALDNLAHRGAVILVSGDDTGPEGIDHRCGAMLQGANRLERAVNYNQYIQRFPGWRDRVHFRILRGQGPLTDQSYTSRRGVRLALFVGGDEPTP
jgi:hypothetical protein